MDSTLLSTIAVFMPLIVLGVIVLLLLAVWSRFKHSEIGQLTSLLHREWKDGTYNVTEEEISRTPRSLSGMDAVYLPKIARDFPEFSWNEWRERIAQAVLERVHTLDRGGEGKVYKTVIARYTKGDGLCSILAETQGSYLPRKDDPSDAGNASREKDSAPVLQKQAVFETELIYIQDADKLQGKAMGFNCINCGAPVKMLGQKSCPYCGTALEPINIRVWSIAGIRET